MNRLFIICIIGESKKLSSLHAFGKRDVFYLIAFTVLYGILVFFQLGSTKVPQNGLILDRMSDESNELVLDLGEEKEVSDVFLYLGYMNYKTVSVSWYDEAKQEWEVIDNDCSVDAVFNWTPIEIQKKLRYLGFVGKDYDAIYNELVILDENQEKILPVNHTRYAELFDEQELFPKDLSQYYGTMFDEVIYAKSLYELVHGMDMYENTHPPLGKILMAIGIKLFGNNPLGWRFVNALLGVLMVPIFYLLLRKLTDNTKLTCFGTALFCLEFMHFTLSRIATIDTTVAFFILSMFATMYFLLDQINKDLSENRKLISKKTFFFMLLCAIETGIAVAVKWTGFYAMAGIAVLFLVFLMDSIIKRKREGNTIGYQIKLLLFAVVMFSVIPLVIYTASYYPMMCAQGKDSIIQTMLDNSMYMLNFHEEAIFEHPYESAWYTWIIDMVPLIDSVVMADDGNIRTVATFGNPVIWWGGIVALLYMFYRMIWKKDRKAGFLIFSYTALLFPWIFIGRTVFIYQYNTCSIMLILMIAYGFCMADDKVKKLMPIFLEAALIVFIMFYPVISGYPISAFYIEHFLEWLPRWEFV